MRVRLALHGFLAFALTLNLVLPAIAQKEISNLQNPLGNSGKAPRDELNQPSVRNTTYGQTVKEEAITSKDFMPLAVDTVHGSTYSNQHFSQKTEVTSASGNVYTYEKLEKKNYLVKFSSNETLTQYKNSTSKFKRMAASVPKEVKKEFRNIPYLLLNLSEDEAISLAGNVGILNIEADKTATVSTATYATPNDVRTWGNDALNLELLHQKSPKGQGIKVAVIDTGVDLNHSDLQVVGGYSVFGGSYQDDNGHGTQTVGVIGARQNGSGIIGIAPQANIYAIKAFDRNGIGTYSQIIEAIDWAIDNKINILNLSFNGKEYSESLNVALKKAYDSGILIVASSGNEGNGQVLYPALFPSVVAVGSIDPDYKYSSFENFGDRLELVAPGSKIYTTDLNNEYVIGKGTSLASAYVTGAAAAVWSAHPEYKAEEVRLALLRSASYLGDKNKYGYGLVNPIAAVHQKYVRNITLDMQGLPTGPANESGTASISYVPNSKIPAGDSTISAGQTITTSIQIDNDILDVYIKVVDPNGVEIKEEHSTNISKYSKISYSWNTTSSTPPGDYTIKYGFCYIDPVIGEGCHKREAWNVRVTQAGSSSLAAPSGLYTSATAGSLTLFWSPVSGATSYKLKLDGKDIDSSNGTSYTFINLFPGTPYVLEVAATNASATSSYSGIRASTLFNTPGAPTGLSSASKSDSITLTWKGSPGATTYNLRLNGEDLDYTTNTSYTFTRLDASTEYTLAVAASNPAGFSDYISIKARTLVAVPQSPSNLKAASAQNTVTLSWSPVKDATTYNLRLDGVDIAYTDKNSHTFTGLTPNTVYSLGVAASNTSGFSAYTNTDIKTKPEIPAEPTGLRTTSTSKSITLHWNAVTGATTYNLRLNGVDLAYTTENSYTFTGLTDDTKYTVAVAASNESGFSKYASLWTSSSKKTVIIIAGMGASSLYENGNKVWTPSMNFGSQIPRLYMDSTGKPYQDLTIGSPIEIYSNLYLRLLPLYNVISFGYDFRNDNRDTAKKLKDVIDQTGEDQVILVAHSMGGLVASKYVHDRIQNGQPDKVEKLITLGTPYLGSPKSLLTLQAGIFLETWEDVVLDKIGKSVNGKGYLQKLGINMKSLYELLPTRKYFDINSGNIPNSFYIQKEVGYFPQIFTDKTPLATYQSTTDHIKSNANLKYINQALYDNADEFHQELDIVNTLNKIRSKIYIIAGDNSATIGIVKNIMAKRVATGEEELADVSSDPVNGDGTVPLRSATIGNMFMDRTYFESTDHSSLPNHPGVIEQVLRLANNDPSDDNYLRRSYQKNKKLKTYLECPVDIDIVNERGEHLGRADNGQPINYAGTYLEFGDKKTAIFNYGNHNITMTGTDQGSMIYTLQLFNEDDVLEKTVRFDNVAVTKNTIIHTNTNINGAIDLAVDDNGDGIIDRRVLPTVILNQQMSADVAPPSVLTQIDGLAGSNEWYLSDVSVSMKAIDDNSGVLNMYYDLNGGGMHVYNDHIVITDEGQHELKYYGTDKNRNGSSIVTKIIKVDKTAPTAPNVHLNTQDWTQQGSFKISAGVDILSGIQKSQYRVGKDGAIQDYTGQVHITDQEGIVPIFGWTIDNAGNVSHVAETSIKIDKTKPTAPTILASTSQWTNQNVQIKVIDGYDVLSGVLKSQYKIDNGNWMDYSNELVISTEGITKVYARTIDTAGNISDEIDTKVFIDKTEPAKPIVSANTLTWTNQDIFFNVSRGSDELSGVKKYQYMLGNSSEWKDVISETSFGVEGVTTIFGRTVDNAGNMSEVTSISVKIDKTAPALPEITASTLNWTNRNVTFTVADGKDELSGVQKSQYKVGEEGAWTDYSSQVTVSEEGAIPVYSRTIDLAQNISLERKIIVKIDKTPPSKPTNMINTPVLGERWPSSFWINWTAADNIAVAKYYVYLNSELLGTTDKNYYEVINLAPHSSYSYYIIAEDAAFNQSVPSDTETFNTLVPVISASLDTSYVVLPSSNGSIYSWGENEKGQLGLGFAATSPETTATQVPNLSSFETISGGSGGHAVAIKSDNTVWTWGKNSKGQLGNGNTADNAVPSKLSTLNDVQMAAAGSNFSMALQADGTVWAWGDNSYGQLGIGFISDSATTNPVRVGIDSIISIAAGSTYGLALRNDGTVWVWGDGIFGQLGDGSSRTKQTTPKQVPGLNEVVRIYTDNSTNFAVKADGTVWGWGAAPFGLLVDYYIESNMRTTPTLIDIKDVAGIAPAGRYNLALMHDGTVSAWGNLENAIAHNSIKKTEKPIKVEGLDHVIGLSAGSFHNLFIKNNGSIWGRGDNRYGQLGNGTLTNSETSVVQAQFDRAPEVVIEWPKGSREAPSITENLKPTFTWKINDAAQTKFKAYQLQVLDEAGTLILDTGIISQSTLSTTASFTVENMLDNNKKYQVKVRVKDLFLWSNWTNIGWLKTAAVIKSGPVVTVGSDFAVALQNDGTLVGWGSNSYGQLGIGRANIESTAVPIPSLTEVASVKAGGRHTVVLKKDGTVWAWGNNELGQLATGDTNNRFVPTQVKDLNDVKAISVGNDFSLALKKDGTIWSWGDNTSGQLGMGNKSIVTKPVQVWGLNSVSALAAGSQHAFALRNDGTIWGWGDNTYGQLGYADSGEAYPIKLNALSNVVSIGAGGSNSFAIKGDGTLWYWGNMITGTIKQRMVPTQASVTNVANIISGYDYYVAQKQDGTVWGWGSNSFGQLVNGGQANFTTPVQLERFKDAIGIAIGPSHDVVMKANGTLWSLGRNSKGQLGNGTTVDSIGTSVQVIANKPPTVALTWPTGSSTLPTVSKINKPTVTWNVSDASSTSFTQYQVQVLDEVGAVVADSGITAQFTTNAMGSFVLGTALSSNKTYQVRVRVKDTFLWSEWSTVKWMKTL